MNNFFLACASLMWITAVVRATNRSGVHETEQCDHPRPKHRQNLSYSNQMPDLSIVNPPWAKNCY